MPLSEHGKGGSLGQILAQQWLLAEKEAGSGAAVGPRLFRESLVLWRISQDAAPMLFSPWGESGPWARMSGRCLGTVKGAAAQQDALGGVWMFGGPGGAPVHTFSPRVFPDALAPSLRGYFSGLEVPSVLLNPM